MYIVQWFRCSNTNKYFYYENVKKNFSGLIFISCLTMDPTHNTIKRTADIFQKPSTDFKKQTVNLFSELWLKEKKVSKQNTLCYVALS